jgi:hypothetical protein
MLKLLDLLKANHSIFYYYRPTKRFWKIILAVLAVIVCAILLDRLPKPESYFTSVYWRG